MGLLFSYVARHYRPTTEPNQKKENVLLFLVPPVSKSWPGAAEEEDGGAAGAAGAAAAAAHTVEILCSLHNKRVTGGGKSPLAQM